MTIDLTRLTQSILATVFNLGGDIVKDVTYVRPMSLARETGVSAANEISVATKAVIGVLPSALSPLRESDQDKVLIRAADIVSVSAPGAGDYIIETATGLRRDVVTALRDPTGQVWSFNTVRSLHQDFGGLTAHGSAEDFGDLTATTEMEDWGALYE